MQQILEADKVEAHQLRQMETDPGCAAPQEGPALDRGLPKAPSKITLTLSLVMASWGSVLDVTPPRAAQPSCVPSKLIQQSLAWVEGNDTDGIMPDLLRIWLTLGTRAVPAQEKHRTLNPHMETPSLLEGLQADHRAFQSPDMDVLCSEASWESSRCAGCSCHTCGSGSMLIRYACALPSSRTGVDQVFPSALQWEMK